MKRIILSLAVVATLVSCGHSEAEFQTMQDSIKGLNEQIVALTKELEGYKYSPDKLLTEAQKAFSDGDCAKVTALYKKIQQFHPESNECATLKALHEQGVQKKAEQAKAEADRIEKEKQERLQIVSKQRKEVDDVAGITWYYNPYFTHYSNSNHVSIYMGQKQSTVWLRLSMSYYGNDWIFFENAYLSYDGVTKEIPFDKYKDKTTDLDGGMVWEWIDVNVDDELITFLKKMVESESAKMRLSGKYSHTRSISSKERKAIKEMIMAYEVLKNEK